MTTDTAPLRMCGARSILALCAALLTLGMSFTSVASAAPTTKRAQADAYMNMSYTAFIAAKSSRQRLPFNWTSDGCTNMPSSLASMFNRPCQQHDFGYRNYGSRFGYRLGRDEGTRHWIDNRFLHEMQRLCVQRFSRAYQGANKATCLAQAGAVFAAVRNLGQRYFYG